MNQVHKNKWRRKTRLVIFVVALAILGSLLGLFIWNLNSKSDYATYTIRGKITGKYSSCSEETLQSNGEAMSSAGLCDSGNSIVIDNLRISTGGGALTANPPEYITDIASIHAGDVVEVRYIMDAHGQASTDCASCYLKKENSSQKEAQNKRS